MKKKLLHYLFHNTKRGQTKLALIMRLTFFLTVLTVLNANALAYSQNDLFTLKNKNVTMRDVFKEIESQSHFRFFYNDVLANVDKRVSFSGNKMKINQVLASVLKGTNLSYKILDNNLIIISPNALLQQESKVSGKITDAKTGEPLIGVSVSIKGTATGVTTDLNGNFSIDVSKPGSTLSFSYVGYNNKTVTVNGKETLDITLSPEVKTLNEVVVVGYGTQKKVNLTGAVTPVEGKELAMKPTSQVSVALTGIAAGVTVTQSSGQPGADGGTVRIRGIGTLNTNDPLVLIDGVESSLSDIDSNDIETISVLKDAASASIYGVRAANGVILITTKRGSKDQTKISYSNYFGIQKATKLPNFVGAQDYMKGVNLLQQNSGGAALYSDADIAAYNSSSRDVNKYPNTNWMNEILKSYATQQEHSFAISGGNDKNRYRFSTNYFDQKGLVDNTNYNRLTVRLNNDIDINEHFNFSADVAAKLGNRTEPQQGMWFQFGQAIISNPLLPVKNADGSWNIGRGDGNPVRIAEEGGRFKDEDNLITANFRLNFKPIEGLTLSGLVNTNYDTEFESTHNLALDYTTASGTITKGITELSNQNYKTWNKNFQFLANYNKKFNKHSLTVLGGTSYINNTTNYLEAYRKNFPNNDLSQISAGDASTAKNDGTEYSHSLLSYFGRINYNYDDKYLFEANIREDGSSRFAQGHRWGTFPSFSAGWRISQEDFMKSIETINNLKLRASWGKLGNQEVGNYPYQSSVSLGYNYPFGGALNSGSAITTYPNSNISWETTREKDLGLDLTILNNLDFVVDAYQRNTSGILLQLPIPSSIGYSAPVQNAGSVRNTGWEFSVAYHGTIQNDFKYNVKFNISDVKNKITDLENADWESTGNDGRMTAYHVGQSIGAFWGYVADGLFQSQTEIDKAVKQPGAAQPGDIRYKDLNGDGVVNSKDKTVVGSDIPRYTYGLNLDASYKGFDFAAFFQGVGKVDVNTVYSNKAPTSTDGNFKSFMIYNSWTSTNTSAWYPRISNTGYDYTTSSYWIKSGAYLRLKTLQFGYTLPKNLTEKAFISRLRLYVGGQNLFTISGLNKYGIDPENPQDSRYYPQVKVYTFGVNVDF